MGLHPCLKCGACCSSFRVSFHWSETLAESFDVPPERTVQISPHLNSMKGTFATRPRCEALAGEVGKKVSCQIYERRPSPCRNFSPSYESGERNIRCDQARLAKGLRPLRPEDWERPTKERVS